MKMRNLFLLYLLLVLFIKVALVVTSCGTNGGAVCGSLWISCPDLDTDTLICSNCVLVDTALNETILYFRFRDCKTDKTFQSSIGSDCTLEKK